MGIKFRCPNGHKLNVKSFLAGKKGICPHCGVSVRIPEGAENVSEDHEGETEIQTGGAATATLTKQMADTVTVANTITLPAAAVTPAVAVVKPVTAVTPLGTPPTTPVIGTAVTANSVAPVAAVAPVAMATPVVPVATAAPMGAPLASTAMATPLAPSPYAMMPAAPVDPIAEAPNAVWYVRPPSGGQFGPARGDIMRKWLGEGRVSADSLVWRDGWQDWKSAVVVFPSLAPAGAPTGPGAPGDGPIIGAPAKASATRTLRAKKRSNSLAIGMVITLGLVAVVLLAVFIYVLSGMNQ